MAAFILILLFAALGGIVYKDIYDSTNHSRCIDPSRLSHDAKIINVSTQKVGTKGHKRFRTTVEFNDGFEYISHDTNVDNYIFAYRISLSDREQEQIIINAINEHKRAVEKQEQKMMRKNR